MKNYTKTKFAMLVVLFAITAYLEHFFFHNVGISYCMMLPIISPAARTARVLQAGRPAALANRSAGVQSGNANLPHIIPAQLDHVLTDVGDIMSANQTAIPSSFAVNVVSAAGAGAVSTQAVILNPDVLAPNTNNGSGAVSLTYSYQDGLTFPTSSAAGLVLSNLLSFARLGVGAITYGFSIRMITTATGAGNPSGLALTTPFWGLKNFAGLFIPTSVNMTADQTRGDFDTSIEVIRAVQNVQRTVGLGFTMPVANTATITVYTVPNFKA